MAKAFLSPALARAASAFSVTTPPPVPTSQSSDGSLVRRYRTGDDAAATALYLRYATRLRALARKYCSPKYGGRFDADDVVQSVFRVFFRGARASAYDAPAGGELWGLFVALALSKVRNLVGHHRAEKRAVQQTAALPEPDTHPALDSDDSAAAFLRLVLDEELAALPESNRAIIRLRTEGHEVGDIARSTGRSRRTVERVLHDFRARLTRD
jgi:RNA polymerase sigma-70 factor (ECF subfamily)